MMTTRTFTVLSAVFLTAIAVTGCSGQPASQEATAEPREALPTPIEILTPDSREDCTTTLRTESSPTPNPNIITIDCGEKSAEVEGTFRDGYTNIYDPAAANDVEKIIVVDGEVRAWIRYGDTTCLIVHVPGEPATECKPTEQRQAPTLDPAPTPTFTS